MEINYDLIILYLTKKNIITKNNTVNFATQKNIFNYFKTSSDENDKFKSIFNEKIYRYGITVYDNMNNNISFWSSLLTMLDKTFIIPFSNDELTLINTFKTLLLDSYDKSKLSNFLKKLDKSDIREKIKLEQDINILQYIVDILDINFIIFDFKSEDIYAMYHNNKMNMCKQTFLFAKYDDIWEPIMMIKSKGYNKRTFDINDLLIKKILLNDIKYYDGINIDKQFELNTIENIIEEEKQKLVKQEVIQIVDISEQYKHLNKTKLMKMKIDEVTSIMTSLKITIDKKKPTKGAMTEKICEFLHI